MGEPRRIAATAATGSATARSSPWEVACAVAASAAWVVGCATVPTPAAGTPALGPGPTGRAGVSAAPAPSRAAAADGPRAGAIPDDATAAAEARSGVVDSEKVLACVAAANGQMPLELERVEGRPALVLSSEALGPEDGLRAWQIWRAAGPPCGVRPVLVRELAEPATDPPSRSAGDSDEPRSGAQVGPGARAWGEERLREAAAASSSTTAASLLAEREQSLREVERERNEWLARARSGTLTDPSDEEAARCRRAPERCPPEHELDDQRASLASSAAARARPSSDGAEPAWEFVHDLADPALPEEGPSPVQLVLVATDPWLFPAVLDFGAGARWPSTADHAVLLEHWNRKYGAELVYMDRDTMELWVERPPERHEDVVALAWEQYLYCPDIVTQGAGSAGELAEALTGQSWLFWWE